MHEKTTSSVDRPTFTECYRPLKARGQKRPPNKTHRTTLSRALRFDDEDRHVAEWIWELIHRMQPTRKQPNLDQWASEVRLMREVDERTHEDIRDVFAWANSDDFWQTNILSPKKLRAKFDDLDLKRKAKRNGRKQLDPNRYEATRGKAITV